MTLTPKASSRRGPGRPHAIDDDDIARVVLEIGFRDLTFAGVAERLGVGQATLYRHARTRDELVRHGLDLAIRSETWPGLDGPWRTILEEWSTASWHAWAKHPGAVAEFTRGVIPEAVIGLSGRVASALVERGFTPSAAVLAVDLVFDLAADNRRGVEAFDGPAEEHPRGLRGVAEQQWIEPSRAGDATIVHAEMLRAITADPFAWFHGKLSVVLTGIAHELAPSASDSTGSAPSASMSPISGTTNDRTLR